MTTKTKKPLGAILSGVIVGIGFTLGIGQTGLTNDFRVYSEGHKTSFAAEQFSFSQFPTIWLREIVKARDREDEMNRILDALMMCESGGRYDISIIDTNGLRSTGHFMYQDETWIELAKRYKIAPAAEDHELLNLIKDPTLQRLVARKAIEDGESWRWANCVKKLGQPPKYE